MGLLNVFCFYTIALKYVFAKLFEVGCVVYEK